MARLLLYYAHPGQRHSHANSELYRAACSVKGIDIVDLYAEYPRFHINVGREQQRLLEHDVYLFQFPMFWYSTPSLVKEWIDLTLEHGFAYGDGGDKLDGRRFMTAITAAGPESAYTPEGYQRYPMRTFLTPLERTARLCHMDFVAPYVLYGSLKAPEDGRLVEHVAGYRSLLEAIRDDRFDFAAAIGAETLAPDRLPIQDMAV